MPWHMVFISTRFLPMTSTNAARSVVVVTTRMVFACATLPIEKAPVMPRKTATHTAM